LKNIVKENIMSGKYYIVISIGNIQIMSEISFCYQEYLNFIIQCISNYDMDFTIRIKLVKLKARIIEIFDKIKINASILESINHTIEE